jgi:hypothetical protein
METHDYMCPECSRCKKPSLKKEMFHLGSYTDYDETAPMVWFCTECFVELCIDLSKIKEEYGRA